MRIIRFIDDNGNIRHGADHAHGEADLLDGDPFDDPRPTGRRAAVRKLLAPIDPAAILCIGLNYRQHARETGAELPDHPILFMKNPAAAANPGDPIIIPPCCQDPPQVDYEAELAVVIGKAARDVPRDSALDHVLGYTIANDVSARRWQKHGGGGQWVRGKSFDTFCPLGPELLTPDHIPDPQDLPISATLNGQTMQDAHTSDMIFTVAELIAFLSEGTTLRPGTVILTGTPSGVGFARKPPVYLTDGDEIAMRIDPIGTLANRVVHSS